MIRLLITLGIAALLLTGAVTAQDVSVRSDHPDEYIVVKGDTLWDISGRFLDKPWQWPAIWQANPQIENPHLIYPGDAISLVYVDGVPQLRVRRGDTVRLSPTTRVVDREAINSVSYESIAPFMLDLHVISPEAYEGLPYIVANNEERITATYSDQTYARNLEGRVGEEFIVARLTNIYDRIKADGEMRRVMPKDQWRQVPNVWDRDQHIFNQVDPWNKRPRNPVGYELFEVSRVRLAENGEISVLDVIRDRTEIKAGDVILPASEAATYPDVFYPKAMDTVPDDLRVLATSGRRSGAGTYQIVSISGGSSQGAQPGHVFSAYRTGQLVTDDVGYRHGSFSKEAEVRLPDIYDGLVMVFRTFDEVSYGMVMQSARMVAEYDTLRHPDERL